MPGREELPSTLERSDEGAKKTWIKAHDSAVKTYGEGQRAHRVAYAALKHSYEKVGDHWEKKPAKGPSDEQARKGTSKAGETAEGVNANAPKEHLYQTAARLGIQGRSKMSKDELVEAIKKANRRATAKAR